MKITLVHAEIEAALINYVATQGIDISDKDVTVDMTAGRGGNGYTAEISISIKAEEVIKLEEVSATNDNEQPADSANLFTG